MRERGGEEGWEYGGKKKRKQYLNAFYLLYFCERGKKGKKGERMRPFICSGGKKGMEELA